MSTKNGDRSPWLYVPSLYFAEGLPFILVNVVSVVMYKNMGMSNSFIGLTGVFYLPWVFKMFWSPLLDLYRTKRGWILVSQLLVCVGFAFTAAVIAWQLPVALSLMSFLLIAFLSATQDIAIDGYYMLALSKKLQAFFLGIRSTCYRVAMLFGSGLLVIIAGTLERGTGNTAVSWSSVTASVSLLFLILWSFHRQVLPAPSEDAPAQTSDTREGFTAAFKTFFSQDKRTAIILFILLYRLGEAMLSKMTVPFLLDTQEAGGLGLATDIVGYVYGTVGIISLCAGGIIGGWLIARFGLKKCMWPLALMLNVPDAGYIYLSALKPGLTTVYGLVALEQFGYGLGFTAFSVFLMDVSRVPYKTSHFAIATGLMALGMMVPGMVSGLLQSVVGYTAFFTAVLVLTVPGMLTLFFIPIQTSPGE